MKHNTFTKTDYVLLDAVRQAKLARYDAEGVEATRYMDRAVAQATAQIQRPSRIATENVRQSMTQRFLEVIK
jgi:hypothetical protein